MTNQKDRVEGFGALVVDDEKNIRLTLTEALSSLGLRVEAVASGTEALERVETGAFRLMLLDLRLPGMDGMDVLRRVRLERPDVEVVIITAHGTVETAVEAMKLGARDYLTKPFTPEAVRAVVRDVMEREGPDVGFEDEYDLCVEIARRALRRGEPEVAESYVDRALGLDPNRPQAHNLLGVILEVNLRKFDAQQAYRRALALDPAYAPARANLHESVDAPHRESFFLSEVRRERVAASHGTHRPKRP